MNRYFLLIILLACLASCQVIDEMDRIQAPDWSPELAVPLLNTTVTLEEILNQLPEQDYLETTDAGALVVSYTGDLLRVKGEDMLVLPSFPVPMFDSSLSVPFPLPNLDRIDLKTGQLRVRGYGPEGSLVRVTVRQPGALDADGVPWRRNVEFTGRLDTIFDLSGQIWRFAEGEIGLSYEAVLVESDTRILLESALMSFSDLGYRYAEGYFGQYVFGLGVDSVALSFMENLQAVGLRLADPRLGFHFRNSFGVPIQVQARRFEVINDQGEVIPILNSKLGNGFVLGYPSLDSVGLAAGSDILLNQQNSNLAEALEAPAAFNWGLEATSHPQGNPAKRGFILDTSFFDIGVSVELPLHGQVGQLYFSNTYDLEIGSLSMESGNLRVQLETDMPFDLSFQLYLEDEAGLVQDSLFSGMTAFVEDVPVAENGRSTGTSVQQLDLSLNEDQVAALETASRIRLKSRISTAQAGAVPVKLFTDYFFSLQLGAAARL